MNLHTEMPRWWRFVIALQLLFTAILAVDVYAHWRDREPSFDTRLTLSAAAAVACLDNSLVAPESGTHRIPESRALVYYEAKKTSAELLATAANEDELTKAKELREQVNRWCRWPIISE